MAAGGERFMRIMVFFDLSVKRKTDRKKATGFRHFLLKDGYNMLQYSVYSRLCKGQDTAEKHLNRLEFAIPDKGQVRAMCVTDTQYGKMKLLVGLEKKEEKIAGQQLVLF